jgi:hypothetical protein
MNAVLAVDFDNTIVSYDDLIYRVAVEMQLLPEGKGFNKEEARRLIRLQPDGELAWQRVQAAVYGPRIAEAKLIDGVAPFFQQCKARGVPVYVVSHKTEYASQDETGTDLRSAAMGWMKDHQFFEDNGLGLSPTNVYFEDTRSKKVERVRSLGCSHLIDDLEETFLEKSFPVNVEKLLYSPHAAQTTIPGVRTVSSWEDIADYVFNSGV